MGAINLRRLSRTTRIRRALIVAIVLLAGLTLAHHTAPAGHDTMPGMHGIAAGICLGVLAAGVTVARRRGVVRLGRLANLIRWAPRALAPLPSLGLATRREPARDGPRRHLRLQVIRR